MKDQKMNLTELVKTKPRKRNRLKIILFEDQTKRLIHNLKTEHTREYEKSKR